MIVLINVLRVVSFLFLARVIISWIRPNPSSSFYPVVDGIYRLTEPVLAPIRRIIPSMGGFDLSTLVVLLVINWLLIPFLRGL